MHGQTSQPLGSFSMGETESSQHAENPIRWRFFWHESCVFLTHLSLLFSSWDMAHPGPHNDPSSTNKDSRTGIVGARQDLKNIHTTTVWLFRNSAITITPQQKLSKITKISRSLILYIPIKAIPFKSMFKHLLAPPYRKLQLESLINEQLMSPRKLPFIYASQKKKKNRNPPTSRLWVRKQ